jgi:hypothetical protein
MRVSAILAASALALVLATTAAAAAITKHATTKSYSLTLVVGPSETMYTQAQVKSMHPKSGEEMLGAAIGGGSMSMHGANERHLELHVASRTTGKPVTNATPQITVADKADMSVSTKLDVVAMEGIGMGMSDLHYGNNVALAPGHTYDVTVVVHGEKASFTFKAV